MKKILFIICGITLVAATAHAAGLDWLKSQLNATASNSTNATAATTAVAPAATSQTAPAANTEASAGLKEALQVGIKNTINLLGKQDGYLGNPSVKILLPKSLQAAEPALRKMGLGPKIDEFILSMNRAAEKAAPLASDIFASAITNMSFDDASKIVKGGNTSATDYLKKATSPQLTKAFQPTITEATNQYDVTKKYQELLGKAQAVPLIGKFTGQLDINNYVCSGALNGLFKVLGEEETRIRTNPAARVTDLLKKVFGQ